MLVPYCVAGLSFQVLKFCRPSKYIIINFVYNNRCAHNTLTKHILQNLLAQLPWWLHNSAAIGLSAMNRSTGAITNTVSFSVTSYIGTPSCSRNKFSTIGSASSIASTLFEQHVKCMLLCFALSCRGRPKLKMKFHKRNSLNERHQGAVYLYSTVVPAFNDRVLWARNVSSGPEQLEMLQLQKQDRRQSIASSREGIFTPSELTKRTASCFGREQLQVGQNCFSCKSISYKSRQCIASLRGRDICTMYQATKSQREQLQKPEQLHVTVASAMRACQPAMQCSIVPVQYSSLFLIERKGYTEN